MPKLEEIMSAGQSLANHIDIETEENGELSESTLAMLETWENQLTEKADSIIWASRQIDSEAEHYKEEADRLMVLCAQRKRLAQHLKERVHLAMKALGIDNIKGYYKLTVAKNGGSIPIEMGVPIEKLPKEYVVEKVTLQANLDGIRQALEAGKEVPGCALKERGTHLRVK